LKWNQKSADQPDPDAVIPALQVQLGLDLVPAVRPVELVRIKLSNKSQTTELRDHPLPTH
jgi:hypothetical protein